MLGVLAAAVKPAVVGNIDHEVDRRPIIIRADVAPGQDGIGVLVADNDAEVEIAERKPRELLADGDAVGFVKRTELVYKWYPFTKRNILAEWYRMDLVVAPGIISIRG